MCPFRTSQTQQDLVHHKIVPMLPPECPSFKLSQRDLGHYRMSQDSPKAIYILLQWQTTFDTDMMLNN